MATYNQKRDDQYSDHRVDEKAKGHWGAILSGACGQADKPVITYFSPVGVFLVIYGIGGGEICGRVEEKTKVDTVLNDLRPQVLAVRRTSLLHPMIPSNRRSLLRDFWEFGVSIFYITIAVQIAGPILQLQYRSLAPRQSTMSIFQRIF